MVQLLLLFITCVEYNEGLAYLNLKTVFLPHIHQNLSSWAAFSTLGDNN